MSSSVLCTSDNCVTATENMPETEEFAYAEEYWNFTGEQEQTHGGESCGTDNLLNRRLYSTGMILKKRTI